MHQVPVGNFYILKFSVKDQNENRTSYTIIFWTCLLADPFWLQKINTGPHVLAYANTGCPENSYPKLIIYISELIMHTFRW